MTDHLLHARLFNAGGELIAEGPCWLDEDAGRATLEPEHEPGVIQKERGRLSLQLESGRSLAVSDTPMIFKLGASPNDDRVNGHRSLYRMQILDGMTPQAKEGKMPSIDTSAQEADTAGAAGDGSAAPSQAGLHAQRRGETPAVR